MLIPNSFFFPFQGSASLNAKLNGKIAVKTLSFFVLTSFFNACMGIGLALLIHPGSYDTKASLGSGTEDRTVNVLDNFLDIGRSIYSSNSFVFKKNFILYFIEVNLS